MANYDIKTVVTGNLDGQFVQNVLHFAGVSSTSISTFVAAQTMNSYFLANLQTPWLNACPSSYQLSSYRSQCIATIGGSVAGPTVGATTGIAGEVGARTGDTSATSLSPVLLLDFTYGSKPGVGKIFFPGVSEDDLDANVLTPGIIGAIMSFYSAATSITALSPFTSAQIRVYSPKDNAMYATIGGQVSLTIGTQRRRLHPL